MDRPELRGKIKTLTQGRVSDGVVDKMALTFLGFAKFANFDAPHSHPVAVAAEGQPPAEAGEAAGVAAGAATPGGAPGGSPGGPSFPTGGEAIRLGGFVYNVELHLPESRDPAVYEALFRALKSHLLS
jgi:hypothetical protein